MQSPLVPYASVEVAVTAAVPVIVMLSSPASLPGSLLELASNLLLLVKHLLLAALEPATHMLSLLWQV